MLELRVMRAFVAVAEAEHVGRAAEALHISQSPLSRQMRQLEEQLGLKLFERVGRRIRLTNAGKRLLESSRGLLAHAQRVERDAARMASGEVGSVGVGFVRSALWNGLLTGALRAFHRNHRDVRVELRNVRSDEQLALLRTGELDLALVHRAAPDGELHSSLLCEDPLLLALPEGEPLARKRQLDREALDGAPFVALLDGTGRSGRERFLAQCSRSGFMPEIRAEASDPLTMLELVASGVGLGLVPGMSRRVAPAGVVFRQVSWLKVAWPVFVIRRSSGASPLALELEAQLLRASPGPRPGGRAPSAGRSGLRTRAQLV